MEEVNLIQAMKKIRSGGVTERDKGLSDLTYILSQNRNTSKLDALSDKAYHQIFEALFHLSTSLASSYVRGPKAKAKSQAASRLSACASVLLKAVQVGVRKLRSKTVKALIEHITQTLPTVDEQYCDPLIPDYFRILRIVLEHQPHTEHFKKDEWHEVAGFLIQVIDDLSDALDESESVLSHRLRDSFDGISRSTTPQGRSQSLRKPSTEKDQRCVNSSLKASADDIVLCVRYLHSAPNAPIAQKAQTVLHSLIELLKLSPHASLRQQAAFDCINLIVSRIVTDDLGLAQQTLRSLIPLICRFWQPKSGPLKDSMLILLLHGEHHLKGMISSDDDEQFTADLHDLLEAFKEDYCKRPEREQLQSDDLEFMNAPYNQSPEASLQLKAFKARPGVVKAEQPWALMQITRSIIITLDSSTRWYDRTTSMEDFDHTDKRRKVASAWEDVLDVARTSHGVEKLHAMQIIAFLLDQARLNEDSVKKTLNVLLAAVSGLEDINVSWAMLAMSSAAYLTCAMATSFHALWLQAFKIGIRHITSPNVCRASCHLLSVLLETGVVKYPDISDVVENMLSSFDFSGPSICVDSSIRFLSLVAPLRCKDDLGTTFEILERILRWLFMRWSPRMLQDRHHTTRIAHLCPTVSTYQLIAVCLGLHSQAHKLAIVQNLGRVSQSHLESLKIQGMMNYLILEDGPETSSSLRAPSVLAPLQINFSNAQKRKMYDLIIEYLITETSVTLQNVSKCDPKNNLSMSADMIHVTTSLCVISQAMSSQKNGIESGRREELQKVVGSLLKKLIERIVGSSAPADLECGLYEVLAEFSVVDVTQCSVQDLLFRGVSTVAHHFDTEIWWQRNSKTTSNSTNSQDAMDLDDDFESQASHQKGNGENSVAEISHDAVPASTDSMAFRACQATKLCFLSRPLQEMEDETVTESAMTFSEPMIAPEFIAYLTHLRPHEFLSCRHILVEVLSSGFRVGEKEACTLLEYVGQELLRPYEFERCEVALGMALDILTCLAELWTTADLGDITDLGAQMYEYFIQLTLEQGLSSPHVQVCMSTMLQRIIKVHPEYGRSLSLESARTSLFRVLQDGTLIVKYYVGNSISDIFGLFILKEHENILQDIVTRLPNAADHTEGIAIRLYVLSRLGAAWSTLLRRCVYHILETPGPIPKSRGYAKHCVAYLTKSLSLESPSRLFKMFAPQIIYTWLETQPLKSLPYDTFGYSSISSLLKDVQDDVMGQIMMRGMDDEAEQLAKDFGIPLTQLLGDSFGRIAAYSIARDLSISPSQTTQAPGAEARLRKTLGKETYSSLVSAHFPSILTTFYRSTSEEELIQKAFSRHSLCSDALLAYQEILAISSSDRVVPVNLQPSFKSRFLVDQIEHLCRRSVFELRSMWSPVLYVYVFRELLNGLHPALGSLHACSVIRRIRILICMAGPTALEGYPLEMALHCLRPLLSDTQCSEDTIGVFQYLLIHGETYLKGVPSFLVGIAVSTLTSTKAFLSSSQESTTQESQYKATMSKANAFHLWFSRYLDKHKSPHLSGDIEQSFKAIIDAAKNVRNRGNAKKGTYESDLLLELLEDQRSGRNLLDPASRDMVLNLLCSAFESAPHFREDILGEDKLAARYASVIWKTCQRTHCGQNYLLWAGRVLGRAFCGTGNVDHAMLLEVQFDDGDSQTISSASEPSSVSRSAILRSVCRILLVDDRTEVGAAEKTLRSIMNKAHGTEYFSDCEQVLSSTLMKSMLWQQHHPVPELSEASVSKSLSECVAYDDEKPVAIWVQQLCVALALTGDEDPILSELPRILLVVKGLATQIFPYILHLVLLNEAGGDEKTRRKLSEATRDWFKRCKTAVVPHVKILLRAILYLRKQPLPNEAAKSERSSWLDIDFRSAAEAAVICSMFKTAILFLEIDYPNAAKESRRSSGLKITEPTDLLLQIYQSVDEPDSFYGVQQPSSLASLMTRLEYEQAGFKSLSFRGAHFDSQIRRDKEAAYDDLESMVHVLDTLDLHGLSQALLSKMSESRLAAADSMLNTARKLEQWDISVPITHSSGASTLFRALQGINNAPDHEGACSAINLGFSDAMNQLMTDSDSASTAHRTLGVLAVLTEADELYSVKNSVQLQEVWSSFEARAEWMHIESFDRISKIISCRESMFSSLCRNSRLQSILKISYHDAIFLECQVVLASSKMSRAHAAFQNALTAVTYLTGLTKQCEAAGVNVAAAVQFESAQVLWEQGEMSTSIRMLQELQANVSPKGQLIHVGRPEILAKLGHQISEARLEKPDEIISHYLAPAIRELHGASEGEEAGKVYHEFAAFCDQQLQNPDTLEDYHRMGKLREQKEIEVRDLDRMIKNSSSQGRERANLQSHRTKAKQWFDIDDREYQRLHDSRQAFLRQSLENYLLCLKACDKFDQDALRFSALWLENWNSDIANAAVAKHISRVGSRKFATLMNQWSSRLLDSADEFQTLLSALVLRICIDHPWHGMYQIFAGSRPKGKDDVSSSRTTAVKKIITAFKESRSAGPIWLAIHNTNITFHRFASERLDDTKGKQGAKVALRKIPSGLKLEQDISGHGKARIPPPTINIELRADADYSDVPMIAKWQSEFTVASGISMPKIATAIGTDGLRYKQLFKSGNDDLRQDSIMEQVFAQVSNLLRAQRSTRQRSLGIRTYRVLPLTNTSGIIEFVPNTIPFHDYLMPAHHRHFPKDLKGNICRKTISDAQAKSPESRIKAFRSVIDRFHPVLKYFFMERFENPDDWFEKRVAYTRSTAAISILGYILGLGDRHGHNILLDEKTGEVVHIDLGIAFEQGRVLPVPEVVPFRLTRDVVDGMGITKTEGVFRRCCEFTLEALRNESYSIMTILDVLRYDPLYSWSLSPLRLKKMQDAQTEAPPSKGEGPGDDIGRAPENEPGEADRALTVVAKKLSKSLSVVATVNELIQQATDERNLALLFAGWAAYA